MKKLFALFLALLAPIASAQVVINPGGGGASVASGSAISGCTAYSIVTIDASGNLACLPSSVVNGSVSTAGRSILTITDTITGASATSNWLNVTGTFPGTLSAATSAVYFSITPDNDTQSQYVIRSVFGAGAGLSQVASIYGSNASVSSLGRFDVASTTANPFGVLGSVSGDNNGQYFAGVGGVATGGTGVKAGVLGMAANTAGSAVGVFGGSLASATNNFAGYFSYSTGQLSLGTGNAALVADNAGVAANIFEARDNGTAVLTVADGGALVVASEGTAATLQFGVDVNGAAIAQTLKAHDGITGTDIKGASLSLSPGLGTGAAVSNPLTLNRVVTKATGTTAQTYSPAYITCPTKILSNTTGTAQTIATITTTSTTGGSVTMDYTTVANNGTLQNTDGGMVKVSWNNNAGTVAAAMTAVALQSDSDASGTLATTPTATVATNVVSIKFTPAWVTIVPTTVTGWATFTLHTSGDTVACQ